MAEYTVTIGNMQQVVAWDTTDVDSNYYDPEADDTAPFQDAVTGTFYGVFSTARIKALGIEFGGVEADDPIILENGIPIKWKTTAGAKRAMVRLNSNDRLILGNDDADGNDDIYFSISGKNNLLKLTSSGLELTEGVVLTPASTTSTAGLRLPHGAAPTSPTNGDLWTTTTGVYARINGSTMGPLGTSSITDHGALTGLSDDDHPQYILANGTRPLTANWDVGSFEVRAQTFQSDVATGTAPFTVASTTVVANLHAANSDQLLGGTWAIPGTIGSTTPNTGAFTTVSGTTGTWTGVQTITIDAYPTITINRPRTGANVGAGTDYYMYKASGSVYFHYGSIVVQIESNTAGSESGRASIYLGGGGTAATSRNPAYVFRHNSLTIEGATSNANNLVLSFTEPTAVRTVTFPDLSGTVILSGHTFTSDVTATLGTGGTTALTLKNTGTAGTYTSVTTDAQGRVTSGTRKKKQIWIPAINFTPTPLAPSVGTVNTIATSGVVLYTQDFADGSDLSCFAGVGIPDDFDNSNANFDVTVLWYNHALVSGTTVEWTVGATSYADGESMVSGITGSSTAITDVQLGIDKVHKATSTNVDLTSTNDPNPREYLNVYVARYSSHAADDLAGTAKLIGLILEYTPIA